MLILFFFYFNVGIYWIHTFKLILNYFQLIEIQQFKKFITIYEWLESLNIIRNITIWYQWLKEYDILCSLKNILKTITAFWFIEHLFIESFPSITTSYNIQFLYYFNKSPFLMYIDPRPPLVYYFNTRLALSPSYVRPFI